MSKFFTTLVALAASSTLQAGWLGLGTNEIDLVRNGVLSIDNSVTVGQLLNSNALVCSNKEWRKFTSDNNRVIVEFSCLFPKEKAAFQRLKNVANTSTSQEILRTYPGVLDFDIKLRAQFIVSADKKSFKSGWNDIEFCYSDGKSAGLFSAVYEKERAQYNKLVLLNNMNVMGGGRAFPGLKNKPQKQDAIRALYGGEKIVDGNFFSSSFVFTPEEKESVLKNHTDSEIGFGFFLKRE